MDPNQNLSTVSKVYPQEEKKKKRKMFMSMNQ